jgi:hypothetical protein
MASRRSAIFASIALLPLICGAGANAIPLYAVVFDFGGDPQSSSSPVSRAEETNSPVDGNGNFTQLSVSGSADHGFLGASVHAEIFWPNNAGSASLQQEAIATFVLDDVIVSGPDSNVAIDARLHLCLDGGVGANTFAEHGNVVGSDATANAEVRVFGRVNGTNFSGIRSTGSVWDAGTGLGNSSFFEDGILADGGLADPFVTVPVNTPFQILLQLAVVGTATANSGFDAFLVKRVAEAASSFSHTFSFATAGDVFTLPAGYTVNSVEGNIVNNRFVGLAAEPEPVPEPGPLALLATALLMMIGLRAFGVLRHPDSPTSYSSNAAR